MKQRRLAALTVPTGWLMLFNNFVHFDVDETITEDDLESYLTQDILAIRQLSLTGRGYVEEKGVLQIYLGWYPDGDPEGAYRIDLFRKGNNEASGSFEHRSFSTIQSALNLCLSLGARQMATSEILKQLSTMRFA